MPTIVLFLKGKICFTFGNLESEFFFMQIGLVYTYKSVLNKSIIAIIFSIIYIKYGYFSESVIF